MVMADFGDICIFRFGLSGGSLLRHNNRPGGPFISNRKCVGNFGGVRNLITRLRACRNCKMFTDIIWL